MQKVIVGLTGLATAAVLAVAPAHAEGTVKIGLIMTYSGQFADLATMMDNAIKLYMKQHGDTVAGKKIELVRKDSGTGGTAPDVAKRLAQELVVRDKADIIAGFSLTPEALAAADVGTEAKKPMVITNAATAIITTRSPYFVRTSTALPQPIGTLGGWAAKSGIKQAYTMVSDYGPGIDSEAAFQNAFKAGGGNIVGSVRFPVASPDFSAFAQRLKDANAEAVKGMNEMLNGRNPDQFAVSAYDGIHLIYQALKKTNGNTDGDTLVNAMKGMAWESPRGPIS